MKLHNKIGITMWLAPIAGVFISSSIHIFLNYPLVLYGILFFTTWMCTAAYLALKK